VTILVDNQQPYAVHIHIDDENWKSFQELIQRGANLWPDAPPEIKEFADLVTNGKVMQDYYRQAGVATESKPVAETGWPYNDKIQCAKRIMEAVDTYHERPDAVNRSALRSVILTELDE